MDELRPSPSTACIDELYCKEWSCFYAERRRLLTRLFWFAGGLAASTFLFLATQGDHYPPLLVRTAIAFSFGLFLIASFAQWFFFVWQMATWPCPRCAKRFFFSMLGFDPFFTRRCKHCGLLRLKKAEALKSRKSISIPSPFGLIFVPLLLVLGGLSIPITAIKRQVNRSRHNRLLSDMRRQSRVVTLSEIQERVNKDGGTLIVERKFPKGPVRRWWTPEDIFALSPYPLGSPINAFEDSPFIDAAEWCRERYTDVQHGSAALIVDSSLDALAECIHWIEIPWMDIDFRVLDASPHNRK